MKTLNVNALVTNCYSSISNYVYPLNFRSSSKHYYLLIIDWKVPSPLQSLFSSVFYFLVLNSHWSEVNFLFRGWLHSIHEHLYRQSSIRAPSRKKCRAWGSEMKWLVIILHKSFLFTSNGIFACSASHLLRIINVDTNQTCRLRLSIDSLKFHFLISEIHGTTIDWPKRLSTDRHWRFDVLPWLSRLLWSYARVTMFIVIGELSLSIIEWNVDIQQANESSHNCCWSSTVTFFTRSLLCKFSIRLFFFICSRSTLVFCG